MQGRCPKIPRMNHETRSLEMMGVFCQVLADRPFKDFAYWMPSLALLEQALVSASSWLRTTLGRSNRWLPTWVPSSSCVSNGSAFLTVLIFGLGWVWAGLGEGMRALLGHQNCSRTSIKKQHLQQPAGDASVNRLNIRSLIGCL